MKYIILQVAFLLFTAITFGQNVSFMILKDKTKVDRYGVVILQVMVKNKSNEAITIFKPAEKFNQKWRYYQTEMKCDDVPIFAIERVKKIDYNNYDLLKIPAKSNVIITVDGNNNTNVLACNSKKFKVKLIYNVIDFIKNKKDLTTEERSVIEKLTPIRIESKQVKIKIK